MVALVVILVILVVAGLIAAGRSFKIVQQYEQGIVFRFGRVLGGHARRRADSDPAVRRPDAEGQHADRRDGRPGPGRHHQGQRDRPGRRGGLLPGGGPDQGDHQRAELHVRRSPSRRRPRCARSSASPRWTSCSPSGTSVNRELRRIIDEPTEGPWGIRVERVEIKDVSLPESMKRSMSRQAEAERERRARIITADGEYQASKRLAAAANVMARDPAALQLRLLQTVVEVAAEKNSTLVMPVPVELLRFFDKFTPTAPAGDRKSAADSASLADFGTEDVAEAEIDERSAAGDTRGPADPRAAHAGEQRQAGRRRRSAAAGRSGPAQRRRRGLGRISSARLTGAARAAAGHPGRTPVAPRRPADVLGSIGVGCLVTGGQH